jgi:formylglycine-generating enzyme required for sulfatase activity
VLAPRQRLTATPYALRALSATSFTGNISPAQIPAGTITGPMIAPGATITSSTAAPAASVANSGDNPAALSLSTSFRTWWVGQNKAPDATGVTDQFFIYDQQANATRLRIDLSGVIYGNGGGLTNLPASALTGTITSAQLASGLTLGGTTTGTFGGPLTGNVTGNVSGSAASFTGPLAGDVTGTQGATVVASVGGVTAANVASGANLANAATTANTPNTLVKRDASGNLSAGTVTATAFTGDGSGLTNLPSSANTSEPPTNVFPAQGMVWIKPGTFLMGSRVGELGRSTNETQHPVTLTKGFWMGVHEVTQAEYTAVIGSNPSFFTGNTNRPVETVSWNNAVAYCVALTTAERTAGRIPATWEYRLPTEAEWEYCCRAGARTTRFGYGDDLAATSLGDYAWYSANSGGTTHPVEQKRPNAWGLMDMHGNVFEWCLDSTDGGDYPGGSTAVTDPRSVTGSNRVQRGGDWDFGAFYARCAVRDFSFPDAAFNYFGFRAVLAPGQ